MEIRAAGREAGAENRLTHAPVSLHAYMDDDGQVRAALLGSEVRALDLVYDRHRRCVYSLAVHLLGDRPAAEDVVQETFLKLWRNPAACSQLGANR